MHASRVAAKPLSKRVRPASQLVGTRRELPSARRELTHASLERAGSVKKLVKPRCELATALGKLVGPIGELARTAARVVEALTELREANEHVAHECLAELRVQHLGCRLRHGCRECRVKELRPLTRMNVEGRLQRLVWALRE